MDILLNSANVWADLIDTTYVFTYGKKKLLHTVNLSFSEDRFSHIAGFQHLSDIVLPKMGSSKQRLSQVLDGTIRQADIEKSAFFKEYVEPRLFALLHLKTLLENDFTTYIFNAQKLSFYTDIESTYLIVGKTPGIVFLFTDHDATCDYYPKSLFLKGNRDYTLNQTKITLLRKVRVVRTTGEATVLFNKDGFVMPDNQ